MLCEIANSPYIEILLGSGTLANDVIAGQLSLLNKKGLILRNGEFGARLQEHAERMNLNFDSLEKEWGLPFTKEDILAKISEDTAWIWAVHSETSTGMLNDLEMLEQIAEEKNLKLCLDCISSIGAVPINLNGVYLASGVSGKALGAFTGLSLVFHQQPVQPSKKLPKYIDLGMYSKHDSIPFSHSSNLLEALLTSLQSNPTERYQKINTVYNTIRAAIEEVGLELVTPKSQSSPAILTIKIPSEISSVDIGEMLSYQGYQLHYESSYLIERNWMQIATVGDIQPAEIEKMLDLFCRIFESEKTAVLQS